MGNVVFGTLTSLALVVSLAAGLFFTADCLSEEKREGTLGFLFLTDLKGYDVVGGKLLATSLPVIYALMAVIPILAVAFLMGAVSGMQYLKSALALLNALFCSLAAGLLVSALSRDPQKAMGGTVVLLLLLVLGGPIADAIYCSAQNRAFTPLFSLASPGYVFKLARDWGRSPYWLALGISDGVGWAMLAGACLAVPRAWQEKARRARSSRLGYWWRYGGARRRGLLRRRLLERNPILWLACRERWQSVGIWTISLIIAGVFMGLIVGRAPEEAWPIWNSVASLFVALLYLWMASQAGRFFIEARRSGLVELLLASPVSVKQVVQGHWRALLRMFGLPVAILLLTQWAGSLLAFTHGWGALGLSRRPHLLAALFTSGASTLSTSASLAALAWFGMWMGMTSKNTGYATLKTLLFVKVIPLLVIYFITACASVFLVFLPQTRALMSAAATTRTVTNASGGVTVVVRSTAVTNASPGNSGTAAAVRTTTVTNATTGNSGTVFAVTTTASVPAAPFIQIAVLWTCLSATLNIALAIGLIAWARKRLLNTFRRQAVRSLVPVYSQRPARAAPPTPAPLKAPPLIAAPPVIGKPRV